MSARTVTVDVNADYGPLILGGLLAFGLSGCVNMQFIVYWQIYPEERWSTRCLVVATWFLDLCHSTFVAIAIWDSLITFYGDLTRIDVIPWSVGPTVELTAMLTFLVQSFFAHRIYRLQNRKVTVAGPVFILASIRLVAASVSMAEMIRLKSYTVFARPFPSWFFTLGLSLSALVDIVITTFLFYFFRSNRSEIPRSRTNRIIDTLTLWTVQTGSVTCLGAIASLICWAAMPQNRIFLGLHFVVGKLHANSLLATLNARCKIRKPRRHSTTTQLVPISVFPGDAFGDCDEEDGPATPGSQRPYPKRVDAFVPQSTMDLKRAKSKIEVSVQQTVESRYDDIEMDVMSASVESAHEVETPPASCVLKRVFRERSEPSPTV